VVAGSESSKEQPNVPPTFFLMAIFASPTRQDLTSAQRDLPLSCPCKCAPQLFPYVAEPSQGRNEKLPFCTPVHLLSSNHHLPRPNQAQDIMPEKDQTRVLAGTSWPTYPGTTRRLPLNSGRRSRPRGSLPPISLFDPLSLISPCFPATRLLL
jgi:hypothetical protein